MLRTSFFIEKMRGLLFAFAILYWIQHANILPMQEHAEKKGANL